MLPNIKYSQSLGWHLMCIVLLIGYKSCQVHAVSPLRDTIDKPSISPNNPWVDPRSYGAYKLDQWKNRLPVNYERAIWHHLQTLEGICT